MTGTAVGLTVAGRFITTIMFTYLIRRSRHAATILVETAGANAGGNRRAGRAVCGGPGGWVAPAKWVAPAESAVGGIGGRRSRRARGVGNRGELAGLAVSVGQEESAGLGELADHLLGHTIRLPRGRTRAQKPSFPKASTLPDKSRTRETRTEIWPRTSPYEMGMGRRGQPMGWQSNRTCNCESRQQSAARIWQRF